MIPNGLQVHSGCFSALEGKFLLYESSGGNQVDGSLPALHCQVLLYESLTDSLLLDLHGSPGRFDITIPV